MDDVALAAMGGTPISVSMPKVRNVPPPATALIPPENSAAKNSKTISDNDKLGCPIFPGRHCCPGIGASPNARSKETICLAAVTDPSRYCRWFRLYGRDIWRGPPRPAQNKRGNDQSPEGPTGSRD